MTKLKVVTMKTVIIFTILHLIYAAEVDLENVAIPEVDIDDFAVIKEKCEKTGGAGTYQKLKDSKESLQTCVTQFANASVVKNEIEEAKKTGSLDEVFGKYCGKRSKLALCVQNFTDSLRPCLSDEEKKALNITLDVLKQLGDFVCYRNGDRIAMFVAEGGVECIRNHTEGIKNCVNATFKIEPANVNTNSLPSLLMDEKKCADLGKLQNCVVEELEKCPWSTPANIVDALFKFIKRSACPKKNKRSVEIHKILKRSVALANNLHDLADPKGYVLKLFKEKCNQSAPDGGYAAFTLTLESATQCFKNKIKSEPIFITPIETFQENIKKCAEKLIERAEACLPEEEKYYPKFYLTQFMSLTEFSYQNKAKLMTLSTRNELRNCFQNFKQQGAKAEITKCFQVPNFNSLKKDDVCHKMGATKECVTDQIKKRCIRDISITKLIEDFFNALTAACDVDKD